MSALRQPAHIPTATVLSLTVSSSSSSTVADKAQPTTTAALSNSSTTTSSKNWRGKYLRALNISTPEVDVVSRKKHTPASVHTSGLHSQQQQVARQARANLTSSDNNSSKSVAFSRSFSTSTDRDGDEFQAARVNRYQVPQTARYGHRRALNATREQLTSKHGYGFALKPDLARGRRCHTDPFVVNGANGDSVVSDSRMVMASTPIQIPTSAGAGDIFSIGGKLSELTDDGGPTMANNNNHKSKRHGSKSPVNITSNNNHNRSSNKLVTNKDSNQDAPVGNLLSWEEPAVMMMIGVTTAVNSSKTKSGGSAVSGGLDMAFSSLRLNGELGSGVNNSSSISGIGDGELFCDEFVETEDEDDDGSEEDEGESEDDEIFEMEDFDSDASNNNNNNGSSKSSMFNSSGSSSSVKSKARRRRTASASQASTMSSPNMRSSAALPRYYSVRQMRSHGTPSDLTDSSTMAMELPESFVPPHQLIQRDCFSIGLRDEFKRRQPKI